MDDQPALERTDMPQDAALSARSRRLVIGTVLYAAVYAIVFGLLYVTPRALGDRLGGPFWIAYSAVLLLLSCGLLLLFTGIGVVAIRFLFRKKPIFSAKSVVIALVILGACIAWLDSALPKPMRPKNPPARPGNPAETSN